MDKPLNVLVIDLSNEITLSDFINDDEVGEIIRPLSGEEMVTLPSVSMIRAIIENTIDQLMDKKEITEDTEVFITGRVSLLMIAMLVSLQELYNVKLWVIGDTFGKKRYISIEYLLVIARERIETNKREKILGRTQKGGDVNN